MRYRDASAELMPNNPALPVGQSSMEEAGESLDLREYLRTLYRQRGVIFGLFCLVMVGVALYLWQVVPLYTSQAQLTLDLRKTKVTNIEDVVSGLTAESSVIGTEMDILRSSSLVGRVVDKLRLAKDPAFNPSLHPEKQAGVFDSLATWVASLWLMAPDAPEDPEVAAQRLRQSIIERLQQSLKVEQKKMTNMQLELYLSCQ